MADGGYINAKALRRALEILDKRTKLDRKIAITALNASKVALEAAKQLLPDKKRREQRQEYIKRLTPTERKVFSLLEQAKQDKEIATALGVERGTASFHVSNILKKLEVPSRRSLIKN